MAVKNRGFNLKKNMCVYIYTYMCVYMHIYIYVYICMYIGGYHCGSVVMNPTSIHEDTGSIPSLASLSGLRMQRHRESRCRSQMQLGSGTAVVVVQAGGCSSNLTPSLGTSIYCGSGPKKKKQRSKQTNKKNPTKNKPSKQQFSSLVYTKGQHRLWTPGSCKLS